MEPKNLIRIKNRSYERTAGMQNGSKFTSDSFQKLKVNLGVLKWMNLSKQIHN